LTTYEIRFLFVFGEVRNKCYGYLLIMKIEDMPFSMLDKPSALPLILKLLHSRVIFLLPFSPGHDLPISIFFFHHLICTPFTI